MLFYVFTKWNKLSNRGFHSRHWFIWNSTVRKICYRHFQFQREWRTERLMLAARLYFDTRQKKNKKTHPWLILLGLGFCGAPVLLFGWGLLSKIIPERLLKKTEYHTQLLLPPDEVLAECLFWSLWSHLRWVSACPMFTAAVPQLFLKPRKVCTVIHHLSHLGKATREINSAISSFHYALPPLPKWSPWDFKPSGRQNCAVKL